MYGEKNKKTVKTVMIAIATLVLAMIFLPVRMQVIVTGRTYEKQKLREDNVTVYAVTLAGLKERIDNRSLKLDVHDYGNVQVADITWGLLHARKPVTAVRIKDIKASYIAKAYTGDKFTEGNMSCEVTYADGETIEAPIIDVRNEPVRFLNVTEHVIAETKYGNATAKITPVRVVSVEAEQEEPLYQYDTPTFTAIRFEYADGTVRVVGKDDVRFSTDPEEPLDNLGRNRLVFSYKGIPYQISLTAMENTNVTNAVRNNKEEWKKADYIHISDSIYIAITQITDNRGYYYISHVVINDPSQIVSAMSYDTWGGSRERPSSAANRLGMVLATNGSYFSYETNAPRCADVFIKNGKIYSDRYSDEEEEEETTTDGNELCLLEDGTLWTPEEGMTAQDLLDRGVRDVWGAGDPLLIQEGRLYPTHHDWVNGKYPRTGIGMVEPCEYYILTAGSGGYRGGLTFDDVQSIFKDLGCQYARTLDGGGSSTLVFNDGNGAKLVNTPAGRTERPVPDFLGFRE